MKKNKIIWLIIFATFIFLLAGCSEFDDVLDLVPKQTEFENNAPSVPVQMTQPTESDNNSAIPSTARCANGHVEVTIPAMSATCTGEGVTRGVYCAVCSEVLVEQTVVEKLPHTEVTDEAIAATCTQTGLTEGSHCSVCQAVITAQQVVDALGHTTVADAAVAATCTQTGLTEGSHCSVCSEVLVKQTVVNKASHTMVTDEGVAATCTQTGLTEGTHCSACGAVGYTQTEIPALGHSYSDWKTTKNPTCAATGTKTRTCTRCGDKETETLKKTEHTYSGGKCTVCKATQPASEGLAFELSEDGRSYYVSGWHSYTGWKQKSVVIPAYYNGKPVTGIARNAFSGNLVEEVILPETIQTIEQFAFSCDRLKSIYIPASVTYIEKWAFYDCDSLETAYFGTAQWRSGKTYFDFSDPYEAANILRNEDGPFSRT